MRVSVLPVLLLLLLSVSLWPVSSPAADSAVLSSPPINTVQADFTQEKHLKILIRPIVSRGHFVFQAPGSLRWEYSEPYRSVLLMHDGRVRKFVERDGRMEEEKGIQLDAMQVVLAEISGWLKGEFADNTTFTVAKKDSRTVVLVPRAKSMESFISSIELALADQQGLLESVTLHEGEQGMTRLVFSGAVLNQPVDQSRFARP